MESCREIIRVLEPLSLHSLMFLPLSSLIKMRWTKVLLHTFVFALIKLVKVSTFINRVQLNSTKISRVQSGIF